MEAHFLFPAHPIRAGEVDEMFADQFDAAGAAGHTVSLLPESVFCGTKPLRGVPPGATVIYRGWMLTPMQYDRLVQAVIEASATPLTPTVSYLAAHYLPHWYPLIAELTPETRVFPLDANWESELRSLAWESFFIKDYVKSLKTSRGSIVRDPSEIHDVVDEMKQFRGAIEGGLCVRRVEPFLPDSERRYFVVDGKAYSPDGQPPPGIIRQAALRIPSRFFSIDLAERADGGLRIVELGDGQVSDLVGWTTPGFVSIFGAVSEQLDLGLSR